MQAIHHAASCGHADLVTSLIDHFEVDPQAKADVRVASELVQLLYSVLLQAELQPLHYAALAGQLGIIQLLVEVYKVPADTTATV